MFHLAFLQEEENYQLVLLVATHCWSRTKWAKQCIRPSRELHKDSIDNQKIEVIFIGMENYSMAQKQTDLS